MIPADWTPHRRGSDRELVGWIRPEGDAWVAVSLYGSELTAAVEWLDAEDALDESSLAWLSEVWMLEQPGAPALRVRLIELTGERVVLQSDDFGSVDASAARLELPWPPPPELRQRRPCEAVELPMR